MEFKTFKHAVAKQFERMSKHDLFRSAVSKDDLWNTYLASFPAGSDPIYKNRTEHDCQCCKQFIRNVGDVVAVIDGKLETIWDIDAGHPNYQVVADALRDAVISRKIEDVFFHFEKTAGTDKNLKQLLEGVKTYEHFFVNIPTKFVLSNDLIPSKLNEIRSGHDVFLRSLQEITVDSIDVVLDLIAQNTLYRGEEHKFVLQEFKKLKKEFSKLHTGQQDIFAWTKSVSLQSSITRIRNTVIGSLLTDLSEGKDLESSVGSFEAKVAPANYKRPTALVTKAMIEKAKKAINALGLTSALNRRHATLSDITVNNILFANRDARKNMNADIFDDLADTVPVKKSSFDKVEEVSIEKFIENILPRAESIEIMLENQHVNNLVSLIAPVDPTASNMFKWDNKFSWSYNGQMADSIKEKVKAAGGNVTGELCCRLAWDYTDDLDFHMYEPGNSGHIYFGNRGSLSYNGGTLDVDANGGSGMMDNPVENIFYNKLSTMRDGEYVLIVNNWSRRSNGIGFEVEIEFGGQVFSINYDKVLKTGENVTVAKFKMSKGVLSIVESLPTAQTVKTVWNIPTNTFRKVNVMMYSPNYWDEKQSGNKHYFFMLDGCKNDSGARGFFNEFLKEELNQHRKVIEMVGGKLKVEESEPQLSGVGFSSTQRNSVLCKVSGAFSRIVKIVM